jgi:hypothetical protein
VLKALGRDVELVHENKASEKLEYQIYDAKVRRWLPQKELVGLGSQ